MQLNIITPEAILFSDDVKMVTIPGTEGVFGVLDGHAPFISTLKPGVIRIDTQTGEQKCVAVLSGIAEVVPERVIILAETAEDCSSVNDAVAQEKLAAARKQMDDAITDVEKKSATHRLAIAEAIADGIKAA